MRIGPYEVVGELGRGGMGIVFRVQAPDGSELALKLLEGAHATPEKRARFDRERRLLAQLGAEAGFVPLLDAGEAPQGPWFVMPLLRGGTLRDRLAHGALDQDDVIDVGIALARALAAAHDVGIVHRDVKPENVIFDEGRPLIADLGIAKRWDDSQAGGAARSLSLSVAGSIRGTAGYAAPEQLTDAKNAGPPADVFAIGAILFECVTGTPAFSADNLVALLTMVESGEHPPITGAPSWLARIIERSLARDPNARPSAPELARLLEQGAPRTGAKALALGLVVVAAVVATTLVFVLRDGRAAARAEADRALLLLRTDSKGAEEAARKALALDAKESRALAVLSLIAGIASDARALELASKAVDAGPRGSEAWRARGVALLERGELDRAVADLDRAVKVDAQDDDAWAGLGLALKRKGRYPEARDAFDRAIALRPSAPRHRERGMVRIGLADRKGELEDLDKAIELDPKDAVAIFQRGVARHALGDLDRALEDYDRALALEPGYTEALFMRAAIHRARGDHDAAIADMSRYVAVRPRDPAGYVNRGAALRSKGDLGGAIEDWNRALELDPAAPITWTNRASARVDRGDAKGGEEDATRAIELDPRRAKAWNVRALARRALGKKTEALADVEEAIRVDPQEPMPWYVRADVKREAGDFRGAVADLDRYVALAPKDVDGWNLRGVCRKRMGDLKGAIADYDRVIELMPNASGAWSNRANARRVAGDYAGAEQDATRAIELGPRLPTAWSARAEARYCASRHREAIADFDKVIELAPNDVESLTTRAACHHYFGDVKRALADLDRALTVAPRDARANYVRGRVRARSGDRAGGAKDYQKALECGLGPPELAAKVRAYLADSGREPP